MDDTEIIALNGGVMGWKQALFLGGSVLLLAACDQATAPQPQTKDGAPIAAAKAPAKPKARTSGVDGVCRSIWQVSSGFAADSVCADQ